MEPRWKSGGNQALRVVLAPRTEYRGQHATGAPTERSAASTSPAEAAEHQHQESYQRLRTRSGPDALPAVGADCEPGGELMTLFL